jgi:protein KRI1
MAATESSDGNILTIRVKSDEEKKKEEDDYIKWLRGQEAELNPDEKNDMKPLREYWCDPELNDDESFLRNYILDQMWMDKTKEIVPTYSDIIEEISESEDESALDEQEDFERKFNFRFEEPEGSSLVSFPRTIPSSVRRTDDTRKIKRKSREERKKLEKEQKKEELRRLKNLKKQEIFDKLEKLKELTGNPNVGFTEDDLQGDFDPNAHDQAMNKVFDDDYYENCEEDEVKPQFNDSDEDENWDEWIPGEDPEYEDGGPHCEDPDFNMDADYNPEAYVPSKNKRKRKSLLSKALKKDKPVFDTQEKSFEEYFDEYYNLDYEDIIGDVPCRFHYRSVVPNDFGLSTEEILTCEDRELNAWVSLKKAVKYRSDQEEKRDVRKYRLKAQNNKKKLRVLTSLGETDQDTPPVVGNKKKKSNKKGKQKTNSLSDNRLAAYGLDKPHNKKSKV